MKKHQKEKQIQTHKKEYQDLRGSAFGIHPRAATRKNFTNKYREYKMVWKHSHKTQSHYTQNYSLIQVEVLSLLIQRIGLNTKFETSPKTRKSFRFSKIAAQPPSHSPSQRDLSHSHFAMPLHSFTISATPKLLDQPHKPYIFNQEENKVNKDGCFKCQIKTKPNQNIQEHIISSYFKYANMHQMHPKMALNQRPKK